MKVLMIRCKSSLLKSRYLKYVCRYQELDGEWSARIELLLELLSNFVDAMDHATEDMKKSLQSMLHQLEVQMARLTYKLGCSRTFVAQFHSICVTFYKFFCKSKQDLDFSKEQEVLSWILDEFLRRNILQSYAYDVPKLYLAKLHEWYYRLQTNRQKANKSEEVSSSEEQEDGLEHLYEELAKCYFVIFRVKISKSQRIRSIYEDVDALYNSFYETPFTKKKSIPKGSIQDVLAENLSRHDCVKFWKFLDSKFQLSHEAKPRSDLKEALLAVISIIGEPPESLFRGKDIVTNYFNETPFVDKCPDAEALVPDFSKVVSKWKEITSGVNHTEEHDDVLKIYRDIYFHLALCLNKADKQKAIEFFLRDLWIYPLRKETWSRLADLYEDMMFSHEEYGIRYLSL